MAKKVGVRKQPLGAKSVRAARAAIRKKAMGTSPGRFGQGPGTGLLGKIRSTLKTHQGLNAPRGPKTASSYKRGKPTRLKGPVSSTAVLARRRAAKAARANPPRPTRKSPRKMTGRPVKGRRLPVTRVY